MTRELQLRDKEILETFVVMLECANDDDAPETAEMETAKRCDCQPSRVREAVERAAKNPQHLYWRDYT